MKILHIIPGLAAGGAERLTLDICIELTSRNEVVISLVTFSDKEENIFQSQEIDHRIIKSRVTPSLTGKTVTDIHQLTDYIKEFKPDIIHSHLFEAEMVSRWQLIENVTYVTHCHDNMRQFKNFSFWTLFKKEDITNYYEKLILKSRYRKCNNHFIAISKDTETYFKRNLPRMLSDNIHILSNAINTKRFSNPDSRISKRFELLRLISVGSLVEKKNQIFLIEVVKILHEKNVKVYLDILGDGQNRIRLENKILDYNLQDYICLKGNVQNVEDYLRCSAIYVHSALYEPFGLVLLEAMASGLPVVCLDGRGNRDIIEQGENGFILYDKSPDLFAQKIIDILTNSELYNKMSVFAVEYAKMFDIKQYTDKLLKIYKEIS